MEFQVLVVSVPERKEKNTTALRFNASVFNLMGQLIVITTVRVSFQVYVNLCFAKTQKSPFSANRATSNMLSF